MSNNIKRSIIEFYLDWVNNWLTAESMASHYGLTVDQVNWLIETGRELNND
jgi:hypothetical protein